MSFALELHFETGGNDRPKLIKTKFRSFNEEQDRWRVAYEHRELEENEEVDGRFYWNDRSHAIRGFALLCIRHFLSVQKDVKDFVLKGESQFAPALGEAVRSSKPEKASKWLLAIVGAPDFTGQNGLRQLFEYSNDYKQVQFRQSEWDGAQCRFFLGKDEITNKPEVLLALARAIEGDGKSFLPLKRPEESSPQPALSLRIYSRGDGFLCVRTPDTAKLLRERGLLPLKHDAIGQIHVHFGQPKHFCLFAFGPDLMVNSYVPHPNLPAGQAKDRLIVPGDLVPGTDELVFSGRGGTESFLLLVNDKALSQKEAVAAHRNIVAILRRVRSFKLPDAERAFFVDELLENEEPPLAGTKALDLGTARPFSDPLERFLSEIRSCFSGQFTAFHFISAHRLDPPRAGGKSSHI